MLGDDLLMAVVAWLAAQITLDDEDNEDEYWCLPKLRETCKQFRTVVDRTVVVISKGKNGQVRIVGDHDANTMCICKGPGCLPIESLRAAIMCVKEARVTRVHDGLDELRMYSSGLVIEDEARWVQSTVRRMYLVECDVFEPNRRYINLLPQDLVALQVVRRNRSWYCATDGLLRADALFPEHWPPQLQVLKFVIYNPPIVHLPVPSLPVVWPDHLRELDLMESSVEALPSSWPGALVTLRLQTPAVKTLPLSWPPALLKLSLYNCSSVESLPPEWPPCLLSLSIVKCHSIDFIPDFLSPGQ